MDTSGYKWRVNKRPRFTVLELGEYMAADDGPRETMLRDMRYERLARTLLYQSLRRTVTRFLLSPTRDGRILADCGEQLEREREQAISPQRKDNLTRELRGLEAFERSVNALEIGGLNIEAAPPATPLVIEGVSVSVQPTAYLRVRRPRGSDLVGALIVDLTKGIAPKTAVAIEKVRSGMEHAAAIVHRHVAEARATEDAKASPDHCIIFHAHRQERIKSPTNTRRMLANVEAVCRNIARSWEGIEPPASFSPRESYSR